MGKETINYSEIMYEAVLLIIRRSLEQAVANGLMGDNHFYITFYTQYEGVEIPDHLQASNPEELTIILQHRYWNLAVDDDGFHVDLSFGGVIETLHIPFDAIVAFADPSVPIAFTMSEWMDDEKWFELDVVADSTKAGEDSPTKPADMGGAIPLFSLPNSMPPRGSKTGHDKQAKDTGDPSDEPLVDNVIRLDQFRPKKK